MKYPRVVWFKEVGKDDVGLVGGKGANLGEMTQAGFPVPPGFIVTAQAYREFIKENNLEEKIAPIIKAINYEDNKLLNRSAKQIESLITKGKMSETLTKEIFEAYKQLGGILKDALVAVRSSATAEDLPGASFAGQQETYLNVKGEANLLLRIKDAWASLFGARAIFYRHEQKFDHFKVAIAIPVQKMVASEKSGVMFTIDPISNDKSKVIIEAIYGLGELIVQGAVTPDHYEVDKQDMKILVKNFAVQTKELVKKGTDNKEVKIAEAKGKLQKITDTQILKLAEIGKKLEHHYYFPQDIEWAVEKEEIYIVQTRPITTIKSEKEMKAAEKTAEKSAQADVHLELLLTGSPASPGIAAGPVKVLKSAKELEKVLPGDVLVAPQTNPDFVPAMKKAVAIVTDSGGRTSHAAIVSREIGIPAVVGTGKATALLRDGMVITVNGAKGEIYKGGVLGKKSTEAVSTQHIKTATKVYANLAEPEFADIVAKRDVDGVGLLRAEFMMAGIGKHPRQFIKEGKQKEFIGHLAEGLEKFCKPFFPRPVVYRASDFKTNEYRHLTGGQAFEPEEPNPMLGFRGAYRYMHDPDVFNLELEAIKHVRNKLGLTNLWLMLPFVRTVHELEEVKKIIIASGLHRSQTFKLWMMVEIPSNVIILEKFIESGIDGVSIGSNDLTMLLLGTDRDNSTVASEYNEQDDAVLWAFERVIKVSHAHGVTSSMCGQAPSEYPELMEKLVKWGITSVSVSPDVIDSVRQHISEIEKKLIS
ncbi:MAG: phosphoenolpyruvate synthase [Patescibacteria group bacterium]|nr:phosphoenolpyruvate synthase [Patescibacteria group bacterium]